MSAPVEHEQESLQRLSHGLARHIVEHWPEIAQVDPREADQAARDALLGMLMVVNPGIQVYLLDADGRVNAYIGEPGMVRTASGRSARRCARSWPVRRCRCAAPTRWAAASARIFSAAMFPPRAGRRARRRIPVRGARRPGARACGRPDQSAPGLAQRADWPVWRGAGADALLGVFVFRRMTLPLRRLAARSGPISCTARAPRLRRICHQRRTNRRRPISHPRRTSRQLLTGCQRRSWWRCSNQGRRAAKMRCAR